MRRALPGALSPVLFFAAAMAAPFVLSNQYYVSVMTLCAINALIVLGLNLLLGFAGQISLGHAAFFGIGAYASAILTTTYAWPIWAGMLAGVCLAAAVAWLIGVPALKLHGHYLAMATLGFGVIVQIALNETTWLTGGPSGFVGVPRLTLFGYTFASDRSYYFLCAGTLALAVALSRNLIASRTGRALRAIHTSEGAATAMGVHTSRYKLFVFILSAVYAAVAGVLYAHYLGFVAPASFGFHFSVQLITMVVLGGMASIWGAVAGAAFLTSLPEFLRALENIDILVYGLVLVLCMIYLPGGLAGGAAKLAKILSNRIAGHAGRA
ncbi:MAG: branched-chain amino acid ABC transporter permease [Desulfovibrionaceae bacterium]|nr:branched-chain amino acid ABC transporter permease [Desulfovibrionaceae bacterium]